ncbi:MAG: radical SAM protein [Deltaproteobacteria bacterium]|nr:radical SAM protein [Deltaproteobacteria bacterium]
MADVIFIIPPGNVSHKMFSMNEAAGIAGILAREKIRYAIFDCDGTANDLRLLNSQAGRNIVCICIVLQWEHDIRRNIWLQRISTYIRKQMPDTHINCTGRSATIFYEQVLEAGLCDSVIRGESEVTLPALLSRLSNGKQWRKTKGLVYLSQGEMLIMPARSAIGNLDRLPRPDLSYLKKRRSYPIAPLYTSRYCQGKCAFCFGKLFRDANPNVSGESRMRSAKSVVDEIEYISGRYGVRQYYFVDDNFMPNGDEGIARAMQIARLIVNRGLKIRFSMECRADDITRDVIQPLKHAGLQKVFVGFESGSEAVLKRYRKGSSVADNLRAVDTLRHLGVGIEAGFIMFDPWTTLEELQENLDFIERTQIHRSLTQYPLFRSLSILPNSEIEALYKTRGGKSDPRVKAIIGALAYADHLITRSGKISSGHANVTKGGLLFDRKRRELLFEVFKASIDVIVRRGPSNMDLGGNLMRPDVEKIVAPFLGKC